jgi:hypothetical protein
MLSDSEVSILLHAQFANRFFVPTHDKAGVLSHILGVPFLRIENPNTPEQPRTLPNAPEHLLCLTFIVILHSEECLIERF